MSHPKLTVVKGNQYPLDCIECDASISWSPAYQRDDGSFLCGSCYADLMGYFHD